MFSLKRALFSHFVQFQASEPMCFHFHNFGEFQRACKKGFITSTTGAKSLPLINHKEEPPPLVPHYPPSLYLLERMKRCCRCRGASLFAVRFIPSSDVEQVTQVQQQQNRNQTQTETQVAHFLKWHFVFSFFLGWAFYKPKDVSTCA